MPENNYLNSFSSVDLLKREEENMRKLLTFFNSQEIVDKFPDKTQRLNKAMHLEIGPRLILRIALKSRYEFVKSAVLLHFNNNPKEIGLDVVLLKNVGEILAHN